MTDRDMSLYEEQIKRTKGLKDVKVIATPNGVQVDDYVEINIRTPLGKRILKGIISDIAVFGDLGDFYI